MRKLFVAIIPFLLVVALGSGFLQRAVNAQSPLFKGKSIVQGDLPARPAPLFQPRPWEPIEEIPQLDPPFGPAISFVAGVWTSVGPGPLNSNGSSGNVSGRITGIAAHPIDPLTIYISTAGGGVWKTTNGGTTWTPMTDTETTITMGAIAIGTNDPLVLYAGTGEANNSLDSNFGRGILTSTNGGTSWTLRTGPAGVFNTNRMTCSKISVNPTNANIAYAAMANLGNNGIFAAGITGIYKTTDGGVTWVNVTAANGKDSTYQWSDVAVDPNTPSTVYAALGAYFGTANNAFYKSTDSGATWTQLSAANSPVGASFGRLSLAISKSASIDVLYEEAATTGGALSRFVRSDNAGTSYNLLAPPNFMGAQGWYDQSLIVDPTNSAIVYASGAAGSGSLIRSIDSGASWTSINSGAVTPHADHHATAFDANGKLLDGNDGGIYRLENSVGPVWSNLNGNLATIQFQGIGLHPTNPNIAIGGSQDNGTEVYSGSLTWSETDGGDGGFARFSPTNGNIVYHNAPVGSFGTSAFFRVSTNGGASWSSRVAGITSPSNQQFYSPFVVDPGNGDRLLFGGSNIFETTNQAVLWTPLSAVGVNGWNPAGDYVNAIGLAPSTVNTIYASAHPGGFGNTNVFVTTDHGVNWTQRNLPVAGQVQDIQVDPTDPLIAYAVLSSISTGGNVFKTVDGGVNWTNISGDLATKTACACALPVWSLRIDSAASRLYIGAEDGVYFTINGGTNWARLGTGLPNGQVFQIELNKTLNTLAAGVHGRGMWQFLVPTAANVAIAGRVLTSDGRGLRNAVVSITDSSGNSRTARTSSFGYYRFEDVTSGGTYVVSVASKLYQFTSRTISVADEITDLDLIADGENMLRK